MMNKPGLHLLAIAYGLTFCACTFNVVAPPARLGFAESPKVTQEGKTKYAVEGMEGAVFFGSAIYAATLRVSRGLSENWEVNLRPDIFFDIPARTTPIQGASESSPNQDDSDEPKTEKRLTTTFGAKVALGMKIQFLSNFASVSAFSIGTADSKTDNIEYLLLGQSFELDF
jgi:hypothetical protein